MKFGLLILFKFLFLFTPAKKGIPSSIYDFKLTATSGKDIDLGAYKGKKIMIVNTPITASNDAQYAELNELYKKYQGKLMIIGILADDFAIPPGGKQPAGNKRNYNVSFPIAARSALRGNNKAPIYIWLTDKKYNNFKNSEVKWDFQKYLINEEGKLVAVFDPKIRATNANLIAAIEK